MKKEKKIDKELVMTKKTVKILKTLLNVGVKVTIKNNKDHFKYLSLEFDNSVLDLVKQKGFYPNEYMSDFEKFKEDLPSKEKFCSS